MKGKALVLEGGGMRGAFTAGVLDLFMERQIEFPYTVGVSAGASNGLSYMSGQIGRTLYADTTLLKEHPYIGLRTFLKKGEIIDLDFLFNDFLHSIFPYDTAKYLANPNEFEIVTTNILSGEACYFGKTTDIDRLALIGRASCSLPFINHEVLIDGIPMYDGGLADSIPLARAFSLGYKEAVVVLTQHKGYRKKVQSHDLPKFLYPKYPKVIELLNSRSGRYNKQLDWIEELEAKGQIVVIRPPKPVKVGRTCTDVDLITDLHSEGYKEAMRRIDDL